MLGSMCAARIPECVRNSMHSPKHWWRGGSLWLPLPSAIFSVPSTKRRHHLGSNNSQSNIETLMTDFIFRSPDEIHTHTWYQGKASRNINLTSQCSEFQFGRNTCSSQQSTLGKTVLVGFKTKSYDPSAKSQNSLVKWQHCFVLSRLNVNVLSYCTHQQNVQLKDDISEWLEWPYLVVRPATLRASLVFLRRLESHMTCWFHSWHTLKTNKTCPHKPIFINTYNRVLNSPNTEKTQMLTSDWMSS